MRVVSPFHKNQLIKPCLIGPQCSCITKGWGWGFFDWKLFGQKPRRAEVGCLAAGNFKRLNKTLANARGSLCPRHRLECVCSKGGRGGRRGIQIWGRGGGNLLPSAPSKASPPFVMASPNHDVFILIKAQHAGIGRNHLEPKHQLGLKEFQDNN